MKNVPCFAKEFNIHSVDNSKCLEGLKQEGNAYDLYFKDHNLCKCEG